LEETLVAVLQNRPSGCEIIVVLDEPYDDPYDLTDEVRFIQAPQGAGLARSANVGVEASDSPVVHLLLAGTAVDDGWADVALERFGDPQVAGVAPVVVELNFPNRTVEAGATYSAGGKVRPLAVGRPVHEIQERLPKIERRLTGPSRLAGFYRRSALDLIGLFSEDVGDGLTALDAAMSFRQMGLRTVLEPQCRVQTTLPHSGRTSAFRKALEAERFFWRWAPSRGWARSLMCHLVELAAESVRGFPRPVMFSRWAGRTLGSLSIGSHRHHAEYLDCCGKDVQAILPMVGESLPAFGQDPTERFDQRDAA
jgi:hypothetical protein